MEIEELIPKKPEDEKTVEERLGDIQMVVVELEGCLTDGSVITGPDGSQSMVTHASDLLSIKNWLSLGKQLVVIARAKFPAAPAWCELNNIPFRKHLGDKAAALHMIGIEFKIESQQVLYMGADMDDLKAMVTAGLSAAPCDAGTWVRDGVHLVTSAPGGKGAVAEVLEKIISAAEAPDLEGLS